MEGNSTHKFKRQNRINFAVISNVLLWYLLSMVLLLIIELNDDEGLGILICFYLFFWIKIVFDSFSCWVLFDAFRRITTFSTTGNLLLDSGVVRLHLVSYAVFILSLLLFYAANIGTPPAWFVTSMTVFFAVATLISQLLLIKIFNSICSTEEQRH